MGLVDRFTEPDGLRHVTDGLARQNCFVGCQGAIPKIARAGKLVDFAPEAEIIRQETDDNDIYFLLAGSVEVFVNGHSVGLRRQEQHVGEMSMLDSSATRSATVRSKTDVVALQVAEPPFEKIAEEHPRLWRNLAIELADRLRRRGSMIRIPNDRPLVFIGSSAEAAPVVKELESLLDPASHNMKPWTRGVFGPSATSIECLEEMAREADFAVIVLTRDDQAELRGVKRVQPRDNTIFELGLFMGAIGRDRVVMLHEDGAALPSDLFGLTTCPFSREPEAEHRKRIPRVAEVILGRIRQLGVK